MGREGDLSQMLYRRPTEMVRWQKAFQQSVELVADQKDREARRVFRQIDGVALTHWYHFAVQNAGRDRYEVLHGRQPVRPTATTTELKARMPSRADQRELLVRDGFLCRFCQSPLLHKTDFSTFRSIIGEQLIRLGSRNLDTHGIKWVHLATFDHLVPVSRSGSDDLRNIVSSCYACNFGKGSVSLEDLRLQPPGPSPRTKSQKWSRIVERLRDRR